MSTTSLASVSLLFGGEIAFLSIYALILINTIAQNTRTRLAGLVVLSVITYSLDQLTVRLCLAKGRPHWAATVASLLWVQFLSASELVVVSRVQASELRRGRTRNDGQLRIAASAVGLLWNMRRVGTKWEVKNVPTTTHLQSQSRSRFVLNRMLVTVVAYLAVDVVVSLPPPDTNLVQPEKATLFSLRTLTAGDLIFRAVMTVSYWLTTATLNLFMVNMGAIVVVLLRLSEPADCPPLYGDFSQSFTIRRFWGVSWHQMFRRFLTGHADLIVDHAFPFFPRGSFLSRYVRLGIAFLISGMIHYHGDRLMGVPDSENGAVFFFLLHALAILLEDTIIPMFSAVLPAPLGRTAGRVWVLCFFIWSSPIWIYSSTRLGIDPAAILPVRLIGPCISQALGPANST
ncbi:membrane bound O-acyl transferase family-domain-containing protein [Xylariomycetidae sp. FL2044]|nr:membrane bound O-acyl transferase family-domain-containing protein [Xylariomycetidae sp. FL2044]